MVLVIVVPCSVPRSRSDTGPAPAADPTRGPARQRSPVPRGATTKAADAASRGASALVLAVTIGLTLGATLGPRRSHPPTSGYAPPRLGQEIGASAPPSTIVAWTAVESIAVLSTRTGRTERTLATHVSVFAPGDPTVSVAPGGTVFFDSAQASDVPSRCSDRATRFSASPSRAARSVMSDRVRIQRSVPTADTLAYISGSPAGTSGRSALPGATGRDRFRVPVADGARDGGAKPEAGTGPDQPWGK